MGKYTNITKVLLILKNSRTQYGQHYKIKTGAVHFSAVQLGR